MATINFLDIAIPIDIEALQDYFDAFFLRTDVGNLLFRYINDMPLTWMFVYLQDRLEELRCPWCPGHGELGGEVTHVWLEVRPEWTGIEWREVEWNP